MSPGSNPSIEESQKVTCTNNNFKNQSEMFANNKQFQESI